jgi:predicted nicotinamide N-methyase
VPSLVAGKLGAALVVATDYPLPQAIATLDLNIAVNFGGEAATVAAGTPAPVGAVRAMGHLWGSDVGDLVAATGDRGGFDLALLGDTLWKHDQHDALLQSLGACLRKGGQALVGFSHHVPGHEAADLRFFDKAKERFGAVAELVVTTTRKRQYSDLPIDVYLYRVTF